jgi:hypothetical protein
MRGSLVYRLPMPWGSLRSKWTARRARKERPAPFLFGGEQTELQDYKNGAGRD